MKYSILSQYAKISMHRSVFATCSQSCTSGTNLTIAIVIPETMQMHKISGFRAIHVRSQICKGISHINNIFIDN